MSKQVSQTAQAKVKTGKTKSGKESCKIKKQNTAK